MECAHSTGLIPCLVLLSIIFSSMIEDGDALCTRGSYFNLCGYCVGGSSDKSEVEGLDRCNVCGGQGDCVGCDGIINSPRRRDTCGMCLSPDAERWNDCRKIDNVYPSIVDLSSESDLVPLRLTGAGLKASYTNATQCLILPAKSQKNGPIVKETALEENDILLKAQLSGMTGRYRIGCSEVEGFADFRVVDSRKLNVIRVSPTEFQVDAASEFELETEEDESGNIGGEYWCFVRVRGRQTQTFPAQSKMSNRFTCSGYAPAVPGTHTVGLVAYEDSAFNENGTGKTVDIVVFGKPPIAETAEYTPDQHGISITFDQNIQIDDCIGIFTSDTIKSLGKGFACSVAGDTLIVTVGDVAEVVDVVAIRDGNSIRRLGWSSPEFSPSTPAVVLPVSKNKVMTPSFGLSLPNVICSDKAKQPYVDVVVSRIGRQKLDYRWRVPPVAQTRGRNQRENMIMWKNVRAVEAELNNKTKSERVLLDRAKLLPGLSYVINLITGNSLGKERGRTVSVTVQETDGISVMVTSFPSALTIVAEARVTYCSDGERPTLRYEWFVDGKTVSENGRLVVVPDVAPGSYNVTCTVRSYDTYKILGTGWTIAEIVEIPRRIVIFPSEIVIGTMDDVTLHAFTEEKKLRWSCRTSEGEPCITVGPGGFPIEEVVSVTVARVRLPEGVLPVGRYIWTVRGTDEAEAIITVSPRIPPGIKVLPPPVGVDTTKPLPLNADVRRLAPGCRIRWRTVHKKGYNYFDLEEDVGLGNIVQIHADDLITDERETPLVIPPRRGKWTGLVGGGMYLLRLGATCSEPTPAAHVDITVVANSPPVSRGLRVTPVSGEALNTRFRVRATEGEDSVEDYPLMYQLSFSDGKEEITLVKSIFPKFDVTLPPGNLTLAVTTCDVRNSCSKSLIPVSVQQPSGLTSRTVRDLIHDIKSFMLSGDTLEAYGRATVAFKTLSSRSEYKAKMDKIIAATASAVRDRLRDLSLRVRSNPNLVKVSFDFLEQSVSNLAIFGESKDMVKRLTEFKNAILKSSILGRAKRSLDGREPTEGDVKMNEGTIKAIFDLHAKILEQNDTESNRKEFLEDVKKYMVETCSGLQESPRDPVTIESSIVTLEIAKLTQNDLKRDISLSGLPGVKVRFNFKALPRRTCLAVATYRGGYSLPDNGTARRRVSEVYEARIVKNGTLKATFKDEIKYMAITIPVNVMRDEVVDCATWADDGEGWKSIPVKAKTDTAVTCNAKDPGVFAAFVENVTTTAAASVAAATGTSTTTTTMTTTPVPATTSTITIRSTVRTTMTTAKTTTSTITTSTTKTTAINTITTPTTTNITTTQTTTTSAIPIKTITTTEDPILTSVIQNVNRQRSKNANFYVSGTFLIDEDYDAVIGKNATAFRESLKRQLAKELKIPSAAIANLMIKRGSILVTVLFIDANATKAETAIRELVSRLHDGNLHLTHGNATVLKIPRQDLKVKIGSPGGRNATRMRLITYGVVSGTLFAIFLCAVGAAYFKRRRRSMPLRLPHLSIDDHPTYRQFHNEFSLDGSSASLARYRRDHPFETETPQ